MGGGEAAPHALINYMTLFWTLLALILAPLSEGETSFSAAKGAHKFHVSYARVAVEGTTVVARGRFFKDDLGTTLAAYSETDLDVLEISAAQDSLFQAYFNEQFVFNADEITLEGRLIGSGEEILGKETMWWYMLEFEADLPIQKVHLTNTLLLEHFEDQKNIVQIQHFPSEKSWSLYFVEDAKEFSLDFEKD